MFKGAALMTELAKEGEKASAHLLEEGTPGSQAAFHQFSSSKEVLKLISFLYPLQEVSTFSESYTVV